jgi:ATP-dependent Clp protease ATP-binding subunit ClpA
MFDELRWSQGGGALGRFTRDLTADARAGLLETVRCRDAEIDRVIDILLRQSKNNPALVGPSGVGKTAIAEGLAQRIAAGAVPLALRDSRLLSLDHVGLLAGTTYRGQYEERLRALIAATAADPDVLLFVDELHNLIGQGTAMGAAMDAANMLKPALTRGEFRVIGATTSEEYNRWVRGDPALERRFQKVEVTELSTAQTLEVLAARRERLERHHNVVVSDDALAASVRLTDLFVTDRARPDRAIDALDEACAHTQARATYSPAAEALIRERREIAKRGLSAERPGARPQADRAPFGQTNGDGDDDPLGRMTREGLAVLERLGAELESVFGNQQPSDAARARQAAQTTEAPPSEAPNTGTLRPLPVVESELRTLLIEEGLVVRGHDVARVVGVATGRNIVWTE